MKSLFNSSALSRISRPVRFLLPLAFGLAMLAPARAATDVVVELGAATAAPTKLAIGSSVLLQTGGGFAIQDFKAKRDLKLENGRLTNEGGAYRYTATAGDVTLWATFTPKGGCIQVSGEVTSTRIEDRALIVRYVLPVPGAGAVFSNTLSQSATIKADSHELGTIFPIAAMTGADWGVSLAIPPTFPCCFGMTGSAEGLGVEFYLGLSPLVKSFPNRAAFRFVIDTAKPGWGFRSALMQYYARYPDFYKPRYASAGFWNWNDPGGLDEEHSIADEALPNYKAHGLTRGTTFAKQVARDQKYGVTSFAYTIVGMRELTNLPALPADYDAAMKIFADFERDWKAEGPDGAMKTKIVNATERNRELPAQILNSTVGNADGKLRLRLRNTVWGASSITYVENPNPDLFKDRGLDTVGSVTLQMIDRWMAEDGVPGVHMDSLGSQWPSCVNYRQDHFAYARYPLTFDKDGRVALHNMVSHYEFLEDARNIALKRGKFLFGNGIDIYESRAMAEHFNSGKNGRFFLSAQLDMAGREITDDLMSRERLEAVRTCLGPKLMTAILYKWTDPQVVQEQMNRSLVYDIFTGPNRFFEDKISYLTAPNGFARDKEFIAWFIKNARLLHDAGWQPVTHARVSDTAVACERYGTGDVFYFAVVNLGDQPSDCVLTVDMAALNIAVADGASSTFSEVARKAKITPSTEGDTGKVRLKLLPNEAQIVKLARTW